MADVTSRVPLVEVSLLLLQPVAREDKETGLSVLEEGLKKWLDRSVVLKADKRKPPFLIPPLSLGRGKGEGKKLKTDQIASMKERKEKQEVIAQVPGQ